MSRAPKIAVPTRTWVAPKRIAISKSPLMPMLSCASPLSARQLGQKAEMRRGILFRGRNAHQAGHRQIPARAHGRSGPRSRAGSTPAFCGSSPVFTWTNKLRAFAAFVALCRQRLGQPGAVQCLDAVEQRHRFFHLVGLQRPDQMQFQIGIIALSGREIWPALPAPGFRRTGVGPRPAASRTPASSTVLDTATSRVAGAGLKAAFRAAAMRARMACEIFGNAHGGCPVARES